jgi:Rrf2 family cysteine metabolism transcriptional repressor
MKLSSRGEYALLALVYLARNDSDSFISVETIAHHQGIPPKFLEHIMLQLKRATYLKSAKGQHGGYRLAKPANKIMLAEIIRLIDGALAPTESVSQNFYEPTPIEKEQNLVIVFREIRDFISNKLENTSIQDVC